MNGPSYVHAREFLGERLNRKCKGNNIGGPEPEGTRGKRERLEVGFTRSHAELIKP